MKLSFKLPLEVKIYVTGPSSESLNVITSFKHKNNIVRVSFLGEEPFSERLPDNEKYFKKITDLSFQIETDESTKRGRKILDLIEDRENYYDLLLFLVTVVNRVLRNIRNYGICPHIHEIKPKQDETEALLYKWSVKISKEGEEFSPLIEKPEDLIDFLKYYRPIERNINVVSISKWPEIEEAVQDDLPFLPERELYINAIEFFRVENNKMALLESINCLEIVLNQYLREFLSKRKKLTKNRRDIFTSEIGLTGRIAGLLDITLSKENLNHVNINSVLKGIEWRNKIVHRYGHLPRGISNNNLRKVIGDIHELIYRLAWERDQIVAEPSLTEISKNIAKKYNIQTPTIFAIPRPKHKIAVKINFLFEIPDNKNFKAIYEDLIKMFKKRDPRFDESKHLLLEFMKFPYKTIAHWLNNKLIFLNN